MQVNKLTGDDVMQAFLKERELSGDFIAKLSDEIWYKGVITNSKNIENSEEVADNKKLNAPQLQLLDEVQYSHYVHCFKYFLPFYYNCVFICTCIYVFVCVYFGYYFPSFGLMLQEDEGGFLKLKRTSEWLLGDNEAAPLNKKITAKVLYSVERSLLLVSVVCAGIILRMIYLKKNFKVICQVLDFGDSNVIGSTRRKRAKEKTEFSQI